MEAKEYLNKINEICKIEEIKGCNGCPLSMYGCGIPDKNRHEEIDIVLKTVEEYELNKFPFGRCVFCEKEFDSELINGHKIKHCPWCGNKIEVLK